MSLPANDRGHCQGQRPEAISDSDTVIQVKEISKKFSRRLRYAMFYGMQDVSRTMLGLSTRPYNLRREEFWAVKDVSFEVKRGETLGIIGSNGSGKTTILKLLNGIFLPDHGSIRIRGRVGALIQLGAGFHPMLTGRENIYINGAILGMNKREIDKKFDAIVAFAGIGDFLDSPVTYYSSGMYVRLGFAIAIHGESDILLIDEVLAVGDYKFQQKAFLKLEDFKQKGITTVLISHNLHTIRFMCDRVIVLDKGKIKFIGDANRAVQHYQALAGQKISIREQFGLDKGSNVVKIKKIDIFGLNGERKNVFHSRDGIIIRVEYFAESLVRAPVIAFTILRDDGLNCYGGTTLMKGIKIESIEGKGSFKVKVGGLYLNSGNYIVGVVFFDTSMAAPYGAEAMGDFVVVSDYPRAGKSCPAFSVDYDWIEINNEKKGLY